MKTFIEKEIDIHCDDQVALKLSAQKGYIDIVEFLIEHGADISYAKKYGTENIKDWANQYEIKNKKKVYVM